MRRPERTGKHPQVQKIEQQLLAEEARKIAEARAAARAAREAQREAASAEVRARGVIVLQF